ncbi:MAG: hypothetical protein DWC02_01165 [Candidatus Poseidoniales archaeon]|nr:MAG: hypothetical protein DWC02_01165 [Candidatus Poseidoniales archaeon]
MLNETKPGKIISESFSSQTRLKKMVEFEWLGQTLASISWIVSVFVYGIESLGDWLQLIAASCWFLSNVAAIILIDKNLK